MRKGLIGILSVLVVLLFTCSVFAGGENILADDVVVRVSGKSDEGRVLFPLRDIFSRAGYEVSWDSKTRNIKVSKDFKSAVYAVDEEEVLVDNVRKSLDVAPKIIDNRAYISIDALTIGLGSKVEWNKDAGTVTFKKDNYRRGNWQEVLPLEKTYQSKDDTGEILANIVVRVPQIENPMNKEPIDKINEYYRNKINVTFDEYKKLLPSDVVVHMGDEIRYETSYVVTYNASDMLSVVMVHRNKNSVIVDCDVFDTTTGERQELHDIIKVDKSLVDKFKLNAIVGHLKNNESITAEDIMFFIDEEGLVLVVNKGLDILEHRINVDDNKQLFRKNLANIFNYDEELSAKKVACKHCKQRVKLIDKTIVGGCECYVFEKHSNDGNNIVAVDRHLERVYTLIKRDGAYVILKENNVNGDMISTREVLGIVRRELNNTGYTYDVCGNMISDKNSQVYGVVRVKDTYGQVDKKIAVGRIDKTLYVEKKSDLAKLYTNADGTVTAQGYFEIDNNLTNVSAWGHTYLGAGSKMTIREDGSGLYYIADTGEEESVEHFSLANQDGKTYIEITNKDNEGNLRRGTRFLVEVKEVGNNKYLYVHDEENNDIKPGNKYWRLVVGGYSVFEPMNNKI